MRTLKELELIMAQRGVSGYFAALSPLARNAVLIIPEAVDDSMIPVGTSKLGGCPDLPDGTAWPCAEDTRIPMSFIAQINFAEVKPYDTADELPASGLLSFFYDCSEDGMRWGFDPTDNAGWRVLYHKPDMPLSRRELPEALDGDGMHFSAARLAYDSRMELPSYDSDLCEDLALPEEEQDDYWNWLDEETEASVSKLLGHADNIQSGMELECEIVTHGYSTGGPEGYNAAKAAGIGGGKRRWRLLMQIDSHEELGMMWGDLGRLYLWIPQDALAQRDFGQCWLILQCG